MLAADLEFSGRFIVHHIPKPDSAYFAVNNIPLYVDGEYVITGSSLDCECALRDAHTGAKLYSNSFHQDLRHARAIGHRLADQLVEMLFSDRGIFESRILFVKAEGQGKNIMIMDWDGENQRQLTTGNTLNLFPAFIDSNSFLWTSFLRGHPDIFKAAIGGKASSIASTRAIETSPSYCPVTGSVAFASSRDGNMEIYTCNLDGSGIKRLTHAKSIETSPCWSPNGYQLAFTSDRDGQPRIFVMDADGANVHMLTQDGGYQDSPAWSPKGDKIAYHSNITGTFQIWIANVDGSNPVQVTTMQGNNEYPAWAPDGDHLAFSSERGGKRDLYAVRIDGSQLKKLTNTGNAEMPDWGK